ncbi:ABC transporter ATP-binding protein [Rubrobacter taiwanensis]|jgi:branched-chain amino acid transport system ATP-binding protein|uniref:ABC transporter ATP-binding protein n=1 Tax=Rubrobacter taiwanensis TaxID=185139 RepID=A0A4R1BCR0_9ACTN|nr:ABC transporter ATP-binding protein [Rubrobacter taiwanensis]TCJ14845.1 ABC transporter ATP-binding protein [Rubrobacter taiwanensis]
MLELRDVHAHYGSSHILQGVSLRVGAGEVVALLGRNGVGKTTTIRAITGLISVSRGEILFKDTPIQDEPPYRRARMGMGLVPQGRGIYPNLSVREQLLLPPDRNGRWSLQEIYALFPILRERRRHAGDQLSGGEQQMLAIARALRSNPELLLLDEPSEGLAPMMVKRVGEVLQDIKRQELSILLVEQNLSLALSVADRVYIMNKGVIVHECPAAELAQDEETQHRLLGV